MASNLPYYHIYCSACIRLYNDLLYSTCIHVIVPTPLVQLIIWANKTNNKLR